MGGDRISSRCFSPEEESSLENDFKETSSETDVPFWDDFTMKAEDFKAIKGNDFQFEVFDDLGRRGSSFSLDSETLRRRRRRAYEEISESYCTLQRRSVGMKEAKTKILSYTPGEWIEEVGGIKMSDYDIPKTTTLILIGPRGCGKSTLVNKISRIFEGDKFAPERAQESFLKSMDGEDDMQYNHMLAKTFSCPYLSFKDDKPVVVITHGDLLSSSECARVRIHLGELLGIPPAKQIFEVPEKCKAATEMTIVDMIRYSLEHADRNLPFKNWAMDKILALLVLACIFMSTLLGIARRSTPPEKTHIDWHAIRHLWLG